MVVREICSGSECRSDYALPHSDPDSIDAVHGFDLQLEVTS
jgi:hypothetical protein